MENNIKFTKMHGLGNDFVVLDEAEYNKVKDDIVNFVKKICAPHFGVGADGLIAVNTNVDKTIADIGWHFYNNDGTMAQMCGNGMRCFAKYVVDNKLLGDKKSFRVLTKAGVIVPKVLENGKVEVNMGNPVLEPSKIPFLADSNLNVEVGKKNYDNHKGYIQFWIEILENNPNELFKAINEANKVYDYLDKNSIEKIKEKER